ncbi:MAG: hypothetical protein WEA82_00440 [Idiomarina sp.]
MYRLFLTFTLLISLSFSQSSWAGATEWFDVDFSGGGLALPVTVEGIQTRAAISSADTLNTIGAEFIAKHNLKLNDTGREVRIQTTFSESSVPENRAKPIYGKVAINLFGQDTAMEFAEMDYGSPELGVSLGANFLKKFIIQIDYPNARMRLLTRDSVDMKEISNLTTRRDAATGDPLVQVNLNGETDVWLVINTEGGPGVFTERSLAEKYNWLERFGPETVEVDSSQGNQYVDVFTLPKMKLGPYEMADVVVAVRGEGENANLTQQSQSSMSRVQGARVRGYLSTDVLKHFVLTLDYQSGLGHIYAP